MPLYLSGMTGRNRDCRGKRNGACFSFDELAVALESKEPGFEAGLYSFDLAALVDDAPVEAGVGGGPCFEETKREGDNQSAASGNA
ncbi:MAG: hypothetical protein LC114_03860 [Bryobacterales bacterium]|nr:hypothetical protein [Bryobacterales bacterium]